MTHKQNRELLTIIEDDCFKASYIFSRLIGKGGFGLVIEASSTDNPGNNFAVKIVKSGRHHPRLDLYTKNEVRIHGSLNHPNIVRFQSVGSNH